MTVRKLYDPHHRNDCNTILEYSFEKTVKTVKTVNTEKEEPKKLYDMYVELFCLGFKLGEYIATLSTNRQNRFYEEAKILFQLYEKRNMKTNYQDGILLLQNLHFQKPNSANMFAKYISNHSILAEEFIQFGKYI